VPSQIAALLRRRKDKKRIPLILTKKLMENLK